MVHVTLLSVGVLNRRQKDQFAQYFVSPFESQEFLELFFHYSIENLFN